MSFSGDVNPRPSAAVRISQVVFDDAVRVNMEEFDMPLAEALADALREFAGKDLSGVVTDGTDTNTLPIIIALRALKELTPALSQVEGEGEDPAPAGVLAANDARATLALSAVTAALLSCGGGGGGGASSASASASDAVRMRGIARSHGGITIIAAALEQAAAACGVERAATTPFFTAATAACLTAAFTALRAACAGYDDARLEVTPYAVAIVARVVAAAAGVVELTQNTENSPGCGTADASPATPSPSISIPTPPASLARAAILLGTTLATKREDAKAELFKTAALPRTLATLLRRALSAPEGSPGADVARTLARDAAVLLARILSDDDMRAQSSHAYEFACLAAGRTGNSATLPSRAPRVPFVGARASAARAQAAHPLQPPSSAASFVSELPSEAGTGVPRAPSAPSSVGGGGECGGASTLGGGGVDDGGDENETALIPLLLAAAERWAAHM